MTLTATVSVWPKIEDYPGRPAVMAPGDLDDLCVTVETDTDAPGYDVTVTWPDGTTQVLPGAALAAGSHRTHDLARTGTLDDIFAGNGPAVTAEATPNP